MELEIIEREEQALMDREEITIEISHPGEATPSAAAVRDQIAAELDLDPLTVEIESIRSSTGLSTSTGTVRVHDEPIHDELPEDGDEDAGDDGDEMEEDGEEETVDEDDSEPADEGEDESAGEEETGEDSEDDGAGDDTEADDTDEETEEKDGDA